MCLSDSLASIGKLTTRLPQKQITSVDITQITDLESENGH